MPRRVSLPAADELFRTTGGSAVQPSAPVNQNHANGEEPSGKTTAPTTRVPSPAGEQDAAAAASGDESATSGAAGDGHDDEGDTPAADRSDAADGQSEHSTAGEGDDSAGGGAQPGAATVGEGPGSEHTGREGRESDEGRRKKTAARRTVPGQGAPQSGTARTGGGQPGPAGGPGAAAPKSPQPPKSPRAPEPRGRQAAAGSVRRGGRGANRRPSGRERHDEKITVYVSAEELMDLEHARLVLRGEHGLAVDRGRIVREAVAVVLADLESRGDASILVRRLRGR
ncbi:hypothetical protein K378_04546 [Streptomyces sp. Amel2xB2]|uniref:hypothetical protein n=1 Tax=Streptomyces sp. Amel2xB2 TaxID=1305829 RepID=UPI000DBF5353|nr:hypothetical protein [Streptomyces sp. Amel2xB2]RAJ59849.1 hypothetical protein K378_04546 [Streptomyces sp. Amel2xB2]